MRYWNKEQKQLLAEFYSNLAIVWLTAGFVSPLFSSLENKFLTMIRLILSLIIARILLQIALNKLK
jgi:hypothetical protein